MAINEWLKKNNLKLCIIGIILLIISELIRIYGYVVLAAYFYCKYDQIIQNDRYIIKPPFPQWVVREKYGEEYTLMLVKEDIYAFIRNNTDPYTVYDEYDMSILCKTALERNYRKYTEIEGDEFLCSKNDGRYSLYFVAKDGYVSVYVDYYQKNAEYKELFQSLFNSIKKK
jgi:hypothetical protein